MTDQTFTLTGVLRDHLKRPVANTQVQIVPVPDISIGEEAIYGLGLTVTTNDQGAISDGIDGYVGVKLVRFDGLQYMVTAPGINLPPRTFTVPAADATLDLKTIPFGMPTLPPSADQVLADLTNALANEISRATGAEGGKAAKSANLSDLASATTARGNLGLGTAATHAHGDYEPAGAVSAEVTARNTAISTAISNLVAGAPGALDTLLELANAEGADATAITNLTSLVGSIRNLTDATHNTALSAAFVTVLPPSGDATGAADKAAINTALAAGGRFRGKPGSTYYLNGPLIIPSNTELDMTGCTVQSVNGRDFNLLNNWALSHPAASAADGAMTSGSNVITTALGASAVVGQTVTVAGAASGGFQAICGYVSAATGTTITITDYYGNAVNAGTTVSGAAVALFTRDSNIRVIGGTWNKVGSGAQGTTPGSHSLYLRHVDGLHIAGLRFQSNCGKYAVSLASVTNYLVERCVGLATYSDGIHIIGPAVGGAIRDISGSFGDDMVAVTGQDWRQFGDVCGEVTDLTIENLYPRATSRAVLKIIAGAGVAARRIRARNIGGSTVSATTAVWIGDDYAQTETTGGVIDQVRVENLTTTVPNASWLIFLCGSGINRVHFDGILINNSASTVSPIMINPQSPANTGGGAATYGSLTFENVALRAMGAGLNVIWASSLATITRLVLLGWEVTSTTSYSCMAVAGTVADIIVSRWVGLYTPSSPSSGLVYLTNGQAGANVGKVTLSDVHVTGTNAGQLVSAPTAGQTLTSVIMTNVFSTNVYWLFDLATTTEILLLGVVLASNSGCGHTAASGVVSVNGSGNTLPPGSQNWNPASGGKIAVRAIDAPPSTNAGAIPTIAAGAGAGTGPTVAIAGTERTGTITVTPGTGPAAGAQATVTFIGTWPRTPKIALTPTNAAAQAAGGYVSAKSTTAFTISTANAPGGAMTFDYVVLD